MNNHIFILLAVLLGICSCNMNNTENNEYYSVIHSGKNITFENPNGRGKIHYIAPFKRRLMLENFTFTIQLDQRVSEWRGQKGLLTMKESYLSDCKKMRARILMEESIINFDTQEQIDKFLKEGAAYLKWVNGNNGLVLGYLQIPERGNQINVSLYQFNLNGKPIKNIPQKFRYEGMVKFD